MGKDSQEVKKGHDEFPVKTAFAAQYSNIYHTLASSDRWLFRSINVIRRAHGDWLAMCKVTELDSMSLKIAFGAGGNYFEALAGLNASISAGKWKEDKPWVAKGKAA